jgi:aminoglycoside 2''-phosphotransferase
MKQAYLDKIRTHFPGISFLDVREETAGWDNHILILDEKWLFRFPLRDDCRVRFRVEVELLRHLAAEMPVPVPDYTYLADDRTFGGYCMLQGTERQCGVDDWRSGAVRHTSQE